MRGLSLSLEERNGRRGGRLLWFWRWTKSVQLFLVSERGEEWNGTTTHCAMWRCVPKGGGVPKRGVCPKHGSWEQVHTHAAGAGCCTILAVYVLIRGGGEGGGSLSLLRLLLLRAKCSCKRQLRLKQQQQQVSLSVCGSGSFVTWQQQCFMR